MSKLFIHGNIVLILLGTAVTIFAAGCATPAGPHRLEGFSRTRAPQFSGSTGFLWPVHGRIVVAFGADNGATANKGIDIAATPGSDVLATRDGTVVFTSENLKGLGRTVIIDHEDGFETVYAYHAENRVRSGDRVTKGTCIAKVGSGGRAHRPALHFEIRKNGQPLDPRMYLSR